MQKNKNLAQLRMMERHQPSPLIFFLKSPRVLNVEEVGNPERRVAAQRKKERRLSPDFESSEPPHSILPNASFFYSNHSSPPLSSILISLDAASESTEWAEAGRVPAGLSGEDEALKVMEERRGDLCDIMQKKGGKASRRSEGRGGRKSSACGSFAGTLTAARDRPSELVN